MEIITVNSVTTRTENPYIEDVRALVKATQEYTGEEGTAPAGKFTVPNNLVQKTVYFIQQAANEEGVTARIASPQVNGVNSKGTPVRVPAHEVDAKGKETGVTVLLFKIASKRKENGRKPRSASESIAE